MHRQTSGSVGIRKSVREHVHAAQFVVGFEPWEFASGVKTISLSHGVVLSYTDPLPVLQIAPESWVIGAVDEGDPLLPPLGADLGNGRFGSVDALLHASASWVGRWIAIVGRHVVCDSWGSLSVFYWRSCNDSNSPARLYSSIGLAIADRRMKPLPASTLKVMTQEGLRATEIVRLWPHQVIDLKTRLPEELCTPRFTVRREAKSEHVANTLKIYGVTAAQRLHDRLQLPLLVPLTGGRDSRTVLSLAVHAGLPVSAFTFLKRWMAMAPHDRKIPPVVAQTLGVSHSLVAAKSPHSDSSHLTAVEQHLGIKLEDSNSDGSIGFYLSRDLWKWTGDKSLLLTGLYFDLMQGRYASFERPQSWFTAGGWQVDDTTTELVRALLQRAIGTPGDTADFIRRTGAEYWAYNQFYLQVVMTAYDMSGHVVVPLANCARFNEIALGCENNELCGSQPQRELLSQIAPRVASLPFRGTLAEPRNYLDYLRRGCPGLRNRLVSALRRFA